MKCILLGTGGAITSQKRHNTSLFIEKNSMQILIDCNGQCVQKLDEHGISLESLEHIFLTHRHIDHIGALGNFMHQLWLTSCYFKPINQKRKMALNFYAHKETIQAVQNLFEALDIYNHPDMFEVIFHSLNDDGGKIKIEKEELEYFPVRHSVPCHGFRIKNNSQMFVYSGDTEINPAIYSELKNNDVLVHECNEIGDIQKSKGHTTWLELESLLKDLPDITLYLVHLPKMSDIEEKTFKSLLEKKYHGRVILPEDGQHIILN